MKELSAVIGEIGVSTVNDIPEINTQIGEIPSFTAIIDDIPELYAVSDIPQLEAVIDAVVVNGGESGSHTMTITENGTYSIAGYGTVIVNVANEEMTVTIEELPGGVEHYIISSASS